ncbi:MAG TPA: double-strand break repair helicase AddA [Lichenihabitans sp.]|jgi:ATP-dependent helicase/nuclease subunit A|nr:double-strand break repair helicase AddA [Lichenihabitans sp.]
MTPPIPADTLHRQRRASAPGASAWVSANAGSGKTHVLAQRVVRLLLAGVAPSRILCVTFTKAAAANMSIRVFRDLAAWTTLDDADLSEAIAATGAPRPGLADLDFARRLFARTVETPGGLKVQTIHAFCERLLHIFPFEANVPARFEVLDDARGADLLSRARETVLAEALAGTDAALAEAVATLSKGVAAETFENLVREALGHREALRALRSGNTAARLRDSLGLRPDETVAAVEHALTHGGVSSIEWPAIAHRLGADGSGRSTTGNRLMLAATAATAARCDAYLEVFLTEGQPRKDTYLVKALRSAEPALCARLDAERDRVHDLAERRKAARLLEGTAALLTVAAAVLKHYDRAKGRRGLLDFDDLVARTRTLLRRSDAAWVLYKLDSGIDHILVDEAQDTSPGQWEILQAISADFFVGAGVPRAARTFFAVGDEKQSIYSFQGARPDMFDKMRRHFRSAAGTADQAFEDVGLLLSFRSARAVLQAVDRVFAHPPNAGGLTSDAVPPPHEALRQFPGAIEVWPVVTAVPQEEPRDWRLPVDAPDASEPAVVLARRIAATIARWTAPGSTETVQDGDVRRPMRPGDIMVLVRSRNAIFEAVIRALKDRHVPVAGADRLALTQHIGVMDLVAAGRAALSPDDDFTLACVLKSPLIGLDDDDLIRLAPEREGTLFSALEASDEPSHRRAAERLGAWQRRAGRLTPFGFYTRLLSADGGRRALLGRLGPEAGDAIDEFIALTLKHEQDGAPSLMGFLARLDGAELSVKRDMEAAGDAVRVMTVHAAKGLEAKVVILPDTCGAPSGRHDPKLFRLEDEDGQETGALLWSPKQDADAGPLGAARIRVRQRAVEEHNRLLYVAMTRAEERLYVAGCCGDRGMAEGSWYRMIEAAGLDLDPVPAVWDPDETVLRRADAGAAGGEMVAPSPRPPGAVALPDWLTRPPEPEHDPAAPPVRPSNPLGAADQFAPVAWSFGDRLRAGRRLGLTAGRLSHALLQHLPDVEPDRRREVALRFLASRGQGLDAEHRAALLDEVLGVIGDPTLAALFGPGSRAEVAVAATVTIAPGHAVEVAGQIDRIAVEADAVHIADFKTGRPAEVPTPQHRLQLALYRSAVAPLYPGRPVRAYLVWTAGPRVAEVSAADLDAALSVLSRGTRP